LAILLSPCEHICNKFIIIYIVVISWLTFYQIFYVFHFLIISHEIPFRKMVRFCNSTRKLIFLLPGIEEKMQFVYCLIWICIMHWLETCKFKEELLCIIPANKEHVYMPVKMTGYKILLHWSPLYTKINVFGNLIFIILHKPLLGDITFTLFLFFVSHLRYKRSCSSWHKLFAEFGLWT